MGRQPPKRSSTTKETPKHPDAVQMLKADHKQAKSLFQRFHGAPTEEQGRLAKRLFTELEIHTALEEELFYPALRRKLASAGSTELELGGRDNGLDVVDMEDEDEAFGDQESLNGMDLDAEEEETDLDLLAAAYEDHQAVKELLEQLRTLEPNSTDFHDVFSELEAAVLGHVTVEEDSLLPIAAAELDTRSLGATMQKRRDDLSSSLAA